MGIFKGTTEPKSIYMRIDVQPELCFTANTAGSTIQLTRTGSPTNVSLQTSTNGTNWSTYTIGNIITLSNIGDKVYFRNTSTTTTGFSIDSSNFYKFVMTGSISASGDVNYLLNKNSTTTLSSWCYNQLFADTTSLTTPPQLKATTLAESCYYRMFGGSGITYAPQIEASTLATNCCWLMYRLCTSLKTAPSLPSAVLVEGCYRQMFYGCSSLETLLKLDNTSLANTCYYYMFNSCSKIKLSTTQTGEYQTAYRIPTSGTGTLGTNSLQNMFTSTGGTFTGTPTINTTYYTSNTIV